MNKLVKKYLPAVLLVLVALSAVSAFYAEGVGALAPWLAVAALGACMLLRRQSDCGDFLAWKDEYAVGISVIDQEHKRLLNLINHVLSAVHCNTGAEFERQALEELVDYTKYHFQREEALMEEHGYPDLVGHKAQHDQMISQVDTFMRRYEERGREALQEVADYLKLWLLQHINGTDKKYVPYLTEHGVQ